MRMFSYERPAQAAAAWIAISTTLFAQNPVHGRKYKPPPPTGHIVVTVEKGFNSKPLPNAAVIFHSTKEGKDNGNLELKTDPDGRAVLDLIETGSHVTLQVFASGFATHAEEFDLSDQKEILVKLQRPRSQVSTYADGDDKPAQVRPGVQEHVKPTTVVPTPASPTSPLQTTPVANTPAATTTQQGTTPRQPK